MHFFFGCFGTPKDKSGRKRPKLFAKSPQKKTRVSQVESHVDRSPCVQRKVVIQKDAEFISCEIENLVVVVKKPKKKVKFDPNVTTFEPVDSVFDSLDAQGSLTSSVAFPANHRYQDCTFSDDENVQEDYDDDDDYSDGDDCSTDLHEEDDDDEEEESFDSYFSLQMDKLQLDLEEIGTVSSSDMMMKPAATTVANNHSGEEDAARDRSYAHSVLIPVENLSQWKEAKGKKMKNLKSSAKENKSAIPSLVPV